MCLIYMFADIKFQKQVEIIWLTCSALLYTQWPIQVNRRQIIIAFNGGISIKIWEKGARENFWRGKEQIQHAYK